jgi:hypothetical protein
MTTVFACFNVGMRTRKREIARAGIYGTKDDPKIVTEKDIKEIEETFPAIRRAPVQFGHNTDYFASSPRLGSVVSVYSDPSGNTLYAEIEEHDVLADAVDSGCYPDVSIGAKQRASDGKMYLHHLAYLGQEPPAIKNLIAEIKEPLGIAAGDTDTGGMVQFPPPGGFLMNLSDPVQPRKGNAAAADGETQKLREENERLQNEIRKRDIALSDSVKKKTEADIGRLKAAMNGAGIVSVQQERFLQIASALEPGKIIELSDGDGNTEKMGAVDALIKAVSAIPPPVRTGVINLNDPDSEGRAGRDFSRLRNKG